MAELKLLDTQGLADIPRPKWLIEDFIAQKSTTMIYGPWGLGKSFLALDLALHASTGAQWNGRKIEKPLKTLIIVAEGAAWWYRRLLAWEREVGVVDRDNLLWIPQPVDLFHERDKNDELRQLEAFIDEHRPDVLIVDTWVRCSAAYGMNEDKATDTAQAIKNLDYLRDKYDVAPVIVHHPTKSGNFRGSGNQGASVERIIELEAIEGMDHTFDVRDEKGNHLEPFQKFRMSFKSVELDDLAEGLSSAVLVYDGLAPSKNGPSNADKLFAATQNLIPLGGWSQKQFVDTQVLPAGSVHKALRELMDRGLLKRDGSNYVLA